MEPLFFCLSIFCSTLWAQQFPFAQDSIAQQSSPSAALEGRPVFRLNAFTLTHTPPVDSPSDQAFFTIAAELEVAPVFSTLAIRNLRLTVHWSLDGVAQPSVPMSSVSGMAFTANISPSGGGGFQGPDVIEYSIEAKSSISTHNLQTVWPAAGSYRIAVGVKTLVYQNDFEGSSDQGWTHVETTLGLADDWQRAYSYGASGVAYNATWFEPDTSIVGFENKVWGTDLGEPGLWNGEYNMNTDSFLLSPVIPIPPSAGNTLFLSYDRWLTKGYATEAKETVTDVASGAILSEDMPGSLDQLLEQSWTSIHRDFPLPSVTTEIQLKFSLAGGHVDNAGGWTIDNLKIYALGPGPRACGSNLDPPNTLSLSGNTAVTLNDAPSMRVSNAPPNSPVWLYYSQITGMNHLYGHCFDLIGPVQLAAAAPVVANNNGQALFYLAPITSGVGRTIYFEAVVKSPAILDSNVLPLLIWI